MTSARCHARHRQSAFTLAEVLAALAFMLIVLPVVVQGIQISSRAGQVGVRKAAAARIAARVMNELTVTGEIIYSSRSGVLREGGREFNWRMSRQSWLEPELDMVTVEVAFDVQGESYSVNLTTVVDPNTTTSSSTSSDSGTSG